MNQTALIVIEIIEAIAIGVLAYFLWKEMQRTGELE